MQPFRVLEHTADVGFEAWGATREEVFRNAGRALMDLIVDLDSVEPREAVRMEATGADVPSLLVNWLSDILYLQDTDQWLFSDFEITSLSGSSFAPVIPARAGIHLEALTALGRGEKYDRGRHQIKLLVKAITYHQLVLERTAEGWRAQVYVDI